MHADFGRLASGSIEVVLEQGAETLTAGDAM